MFRIDERSISAHLLRFGHYVQCNGSFTRRLGSEYLDDPASRDTPNSECYIEAYRACRYRFYVEMGFFSQPHDSTLAELLFYLAERYLQCLFLSNI